jgi:hypothetical protein
MNHINNVVLSDEAWIKVVMVINFVFYAYTPRRPGPVARLGPTENGLFFRAAKYIG